MRIVWYGILTLVLVMGCVEGPELVYVNAKENFPGQEFPYVEGYAFVSLVGVETDAVLDPNRTRVSAASYVGEPSFTYTIQELTHEPELGKLSSVEIGGKKVYYWYWGEIPFVVGTAYSAVWVVNESLHSVSVVNASEGLGVVEEVLGAGEALDYEGYEFIEGVERLPEAYIPWELYAVSVFDKGLYDIATGYYITDELQTVELIVVEGEIEYLIREMADGLEDAKGARIGSIAFFEGVVPGEEPKFRKIYQRGDVGIVATTALEQKEGNMELIDFLIERAGAIP